MSDTPNAGTEANRQTIRQALEAWQQETGLISEVFAPEMVWRIEGHSLASKEYRSSQQFIDEVLTPFGARFLASEPFRPTMIRSVHADGDTIIVCWDGHGIANDGQPYENSYAWFMKLRDGRSSTALPSTTASRSTTCGPESNLGVDVRLRRLREEE